jgi:hypothetical protein
VYLFGGVVEGEAGLGEDVEAEVAAATVCRWAGRRSRARPCVCRSCSSNSVHSPGVGSRYSSGELGNAILKTRWKALRRIRLSPQRIGDITAAALVLSTLDRGNY